MNVHFGTKIRLWNWRDVASWTTSGATSNSCQSDYHYLHALKKTKVKKNKQGFLGNIMAWYNILYSAKAMGRWRWEWALAFFFFIPNWGLGWLFDIIFIPFIWKNKDKRSVRMCFSFFNYKLLVSTLRLFCKLTHKFLIL